MNKMLLIFAYVLLLSCKLIRSDEALTSFNDSQIIDCDVWSNANVFANKEHHFYFDFKAYLIVINDFAELSKLSACSKNNYKIDILLEQIIKFYAFNMNLFYESIFDLQNILNMFNFGQYYDHQITIMFQNFAGFNYDINLTRKNDFPIKNYQIQFFESKFVFYLNRKIITNETCNVENFNGKTNNYFGSFYIVYFDDFTLYDTKICPYVFHNSKIADLVLKNIANSLIFRNKLEFSALDTFKVDISSINTNFVRLSLVVCFMRIDSNLISKHVFKNIRFLNLIGILYDIQPDLFKNFKQLKYITIQSDANIKDFFNSGLEWVNHLNPKVNINLSSESEIQMTSTGAVIVEFNQMLTLFKIDYEYPDEDFCLFKDFPFRQLVLPKFIFLKNPICTCTLVWLIQYYALYVKYVRSLGIPSFNTKASNLDLNITLDDCLKNLSLLVKSCEFETRISLCPQNSEHKTSFRASFPGQRYLYFDFKWVEYIFEVYLKTIFCFFGLFSNILTLLIIKNKRKKRLFQNVMYKHIEFYSAFNIGLCLIHVISLINICIFPKTSFCSSIHKSIFSQNIKIYLKFFVGNALKICANFSYTIFSLSRYFLYSSSETNRFFQKLKKLNIKVFYLILTISALIFSLFKVFEFKPNEVYSSYDRNFPYAPYDVNYCELNLFNSTMVSFACRSFPILNLANSILNYIVFFVISCVIDVLMVRFTNENLERKLHLSHDQTHINEAINLKKNITKMILINGILYFVSRVPDFILTFAFVIFKHKFTLFCFYFFNCEKILELTQTLIFLPISLNLFVFLRFDHHFRNSFHELVKHSFYKEK